MPRKGAKLSTAAAERQTAAVEAYHAANYENLSLHMRKGKRDAWKRLAEARGTSMSAMIQDYMDGEYRREFGKDIEEELNMKSWKEDIVRRIVEAAEGQRIISLQEIAAEAGLRHIGRQDTVDIQLHVEKALPNYHAVRMLKTGDARESLFTTLTFVENGVEFSDGAEFVEK